MENPDHHQIGLITARKPFIHAGNKHQQFLVSWSSAQGADMSDALLRPLRKRSFMLLRVGIFLFVLCSFRTSRLQSSFPSRAKKRLTAAPACPRRGFCIALVICFMAICCWSFQLQPENGFYIGPTCIALSSSVLLRRPSNASKTSPTLSGASL